MHFIAIFLSGWVLLEGGLFVWHDSQATQGAIGLPTKIVLKFYSSSENVF